MLLADDDAMNGIAMFDLVTNTVILAILVGIMVSFLLRIDKKTEQMDERDHTSNARGDRIAYLLLVIFVCLLIGQIVVNERMPDALQNRLFELSPIVIGHLLLIALVLSSTLKVIVQLFYYRRGY